jgi:hypothetical protein
LERKAESGKITVAAPRNPCDYRGVLYLEGYKMKSLIAIAATTLLSGCSSIVNDRIQQVEFTSPEPVAFTVTSKHRRTVSGVTPAVLKLDSAVGAFECETYSILTETGRTIALETTIPAAFWAGAVLIDGGIVDMVSGNMCQLPGKVEL